MALGRRCRTCGARAVHRAHRQDWQRWLAWIVPLRPQHCIECGAGSWGPLHLDEGFARYAVAAAFWLLVLAMLWPRGDAAAPLVVESRVASVATPKPEPLAPATTAAETPLAAQPAPYDVPAQAAIIVEASLEDAPPADARQRAMRLDGIDVSWTGDAMKVVVRGGDDVLFHVLRFDDDVQGYVLDLPGRWTLPNSLRMTRSFERSNLLRLRVGRHRDLLRIVFSLRDPSAPEPQIEQGDGELRLLIR